MWLEVDSVIFSRFGRLCVKLKVSSRIIMFSSVFIRFMGVVCVMLLVLVLVVY